MLAGAIIGHTEVLLKQVLQFTYPADSVTSRYFREHGTLGHRDRGLVAEAVFAVLRQKLEFSQFAQSGSGPFERRLALLGLALVAGMPDVIARASPVEAQWLARIREVERASLAFELRANLPDWILARLRLRMSDAEIEQLCTALNRSAPLDLRVNVMKMTREDALEVLKVEGMGGVATPYSPTGIRLDGKPALNRLALFAQGGIEVQDEGSQLLAFLVAPKRGEFVVDFCAGAGGKTLALGAQMRSTGRLYAMDVSVKRLAQLKPRLARSGLSNVHTMALDTERDARLKRYVGKANRVLVDAPCSGLGTLRRNPDLKWRQSEDSMESLKATQAAILSSASRLVAAGGRLVYATCSLLQDENQDQVKTFLASHADFSLADAGEILARQHIGGLEGQMLELWPHRHGTDGFFAAVLERNA